MAKEAVPCQASFWDDHKKSQGQTLRHAGVWLRGDVFTHGQLYVACSRVGSPENLYFALMPDASTGQLLAKNVVYKEVLLD